MSKITLGITGLHEVLGRDFGRKRDGYKQLPVSVEFPKYGNTLFRPVGPSENESHLPLGRHYRSPVASRFGKLHLNSHLSYPMLPNTPAI